MRSEERSRDSRGPPIATKCSTAVTAVAFWLAVVFPLVYVPLLLAGDVVPVDTRITVALLGVHVLTLLLGHRHVPERDGGRFQLS